MATTSTPHRCSKRIVAALISGAITVCTQPVSSATRLRRAAGSECAEPALLRRARAPPRRELEQRTQRRRREARERPHQSRGRQSKTHALGIRQHSGERRAQPALRERAPVRLLHVHARVVDQMLVVDARRTRRHAREAAQAAVDVPHDIARRWPIVLEHLLDEIDAAARAIELVTEQHVSRAGRGAETAVHALAQYRLAGRHDGALELLGGETGLHDASFSPCGRGSGCREDRRHCAAARPPLRRRAAAAETRQSPRARRRAL